MVSSFSLESFSYVFWSFSTSYQSRAGDGFRIIASKRSSKDDIYRAMFLEDDD